MPAAWGAAVGGAASLVMLAVLALLHSASGLSVPWLLSDWGSVVLRSSAEGHHAVTVMAGLTVDILVGALLGLLYAVSQQLRIPARGQVAVGIWYGILIWFAGRLFARLVLIDAVVRAMRSWPWLAGCVAFGLSLAAATIVHGKRHPSSAGMVARD